MQASTNTFEATFGSKKLLFKENAEQTQKIWDAMIKKHLSSEADAAKKRLEIEKELARQIQLLKDKQLVDGLTSEKEAILKAKEEELRELKYQDKAFEDEKQKLKVRAIDASHNYEIERYKKLSAEKRKAYNAEVGYEASKDEAARKKALNDELNKLKELKKARAAVKDKKGVGKAEADRLDKQIKEKEDTIRSINAADPRKEYSTLALISSKQAREARRDDNFERNNERILAAKENIATKTGRLEEIDQAWKQSKAYQDYQKKINDAKKKGDKDELKNLLAHQKTAANNWKKRHGYLKEEQQLQQELAEDKKELADAEQDAVNDTIKDTLIVGVGNAVSKAADNISGHLNDIYGSQGRMMGRLQGSDIKWNKSLLDVTTTVGMSGLVSQKKIVKKMEELVDSGVAYNLELRAFLAETSENIASTFDAANGTLLRMIRLQQADTTTARLGMEAMLTKLFNEYFKDTSYLTQSGPSDAITSAIMDASATMGRDQSLEFEFTVQKWLGSLYSLGMSAEAVQQIAQGINYLGTGNVTALSNNPALQTLFAMSASRAGGKSYAQMLTTGLTNEDTNKLLRAMIEYLAQIAESQTNYVTKAAYADLFNMSITDLSTFHSLTTKEIENLFKTNTDYKTLTKETENQLKQVITRVSMAQMLDTVIENAEVGAASLIGSNPITYGMWKALSILKDYVGKVEIPGITAAGFGLASGMDLLNLAQTAMAGLGLVGSLISGVASMAQGGAMNLNAWSFEEYTQRGGGLSILNAGSAETTSYSAMIGAGGGSGEDIETVTMESGKNKGNEASGTSSEEMEEQKEIPQKILDAIAGDSTPTVLSLLQEIDDRLDPGRVFYTAIAGVLSKDTVSNITNLSSQLAVARSASETVEPNNASSTAGTTTVSNSDTLSGHSLSSSENNVSDLSDIINAAVASAVRSVIDSYGMFGIPVSLTNSGGM